MAPDNAALQVFYGTLPLMGTALLAIYQNNKRLDDMRNAFEKRIEDLTAEMRTGFKDVKAHLGRVEDRVTDLEKGLRLVR